MFPFFVHCSFIVRSLFVLCSFIVRSLFVLCSSFVRLLFVFCSSFVRLLFVLCSSFVRSLFVFCSSLRRYSSPFGGGRGRLPLSFHYLLVRLALSICLCGSHRHLFVIPSSHFSVTTLPFLRRGLGRGYFLHLPVVLRLPVRLVPLTLHFSLNCFPILIKILHRDFFPIKANIFKLSCYLTAFAYNDDSEVF